MEFRPPDVERVRPTTKRAFRAMMFLAQGYDAVNSGNLSRRRGYVWNEVTPWYRPFSHNGAAGYAVGFAVADLLLGAAARQLHLGRRGEEMVELLQTEQALHGIYFTEMHRENRRL